MPGTTKTAGRDLARHIPLTVIAVVAAVGAITLRDSLSFETLAEHREALLAFRDGNILGMALAFVAIYVLIVAFSLPGAAVASVTGGFLFGLGPGTALNALSATLGASAIFWAATTGLGQTLSRKLDASEGRVGALNAALRENEVSVLLLLRLVPAVPFFVANIVPALVGVPLGRFVITTFFGIMPGAVVYTSVGAGLGEVFARGEAPDLGILFTAPILLPILGLCALAALPIALRALRGRKGL